MAEGTAVNRIERVPLIWMHFPTEINGLKIEIGGKKVGREEEKREKRERKRTVRMKRKM